MKDRIIEIVELGQPQSLIQRENAHITELIKTDLLIEELNEQLRSYNVVGRSEQLIAKEQDAFDKGYTKGWTEGFNSGQREQLVKFSRHIQKYKNEGLDFDCVEREVEHYLTNCH